VRANPEGYSNGDYTSMKSKFLNTNDGKIHYLEGGKGDTVILLPSLWLTSRLYKIFAEQLSQDYQVLIPDFYKGKSQFKSSV